MAIRVSWSRPAGVLVASVAGRVDSANSMAFRTALEEGIAEDDRTLVLDFRHLSYLSSAGLRVLLIVARRFRQPDHAVGMCHLTEPIRHVMSISGFDKVIPIHETRTEALAAVSGTSSADAVGEDEPAAPDLQDAGEGVPIPVRNAVNLEMVGDNMADIAGFTVEKYELDNGDLPPDVRAAVVAAIRKVLWEEVEVWMERRKEVLAGMFRKAAATLEETVAQGTR